MESGVKPAAANWFENMRKEEAEILHHQITRTMTKIKLNFAKANSPVSRDQLAELREYDNLTINVSESQILKRMSEDDFEAAKDALESGESVVIEG